MKHIKQQQKRKRRIAAAKQSAAETREMFWKMVSRKGGIHIRF